MIPLFKTKHKSLDITNLPFCSLSQQWNGESSDNFIRYKLLQKPEVFEVQVQFPETNNYDKTLSVGSFKEGLWEQDVFEIFIKHKDQDILYSELNISPSGAFWLCSFDAPRKRVRSQALESTIESIKITSSVNSIKLSMKLIDYSALNICSCLGLKDQNRSYLSVVTLPKLDFHLEEGFEQPTVMQVY